MLMRPFLPDQKGVLSAHYVPTTAARSADATTPGSRTNSPAAIAWARREADMSLAAIGGGAMRAFVAHTCTNQRAWHLRAAALAGHLPDFW